MNLKQIFPRPFLVLAVILGSVFSSAAASLTLTPEKATAVYQPGEKIIWRATVHGDPTDITAATYVLKQGGETIIGEGSVIFKNGIATIETSLAQSGTVLAEITATNAEHQTIHALAGAAVVPDQIPVSAPCPEDFDAFWKTKLTELASIPENPVFKPESSGRTNVAYWKVTLDNIHGTHIQGQLARPKTSGKKFPAMLVVQWAGVYPLQKTWVTEHAAEGWLVLNIMAHDLPIDEPKSFYEQQATNVLNNYTAIGNDDREQSYFLRMFLGDYRAVEFLSRQPDWDGKTLIITGTSQGGLQSFVSAALNPKVTAVLALVPAGCDNTGAVAGRKPGWPYWLANGGTHDAKKVSDTSRYFDGVNFAARVQCPVLVGVGLIDTTAPPSGVFAAYNQIRSPKEIVVMPDSDHQGHGHTQTPFTTRAAVWRQALLAGQPVPPK